MTKKFQITKNSYLSSKLPKAWSAKYRIISDDEVFVSIISKHRKKRTSYPLCSTQFHFHQQSMNPMKCYVILPSSNLFIFLICCKFTEDFSYLFPGVNHQLIPYFRFDKKIRTRICTDTPVFLFSSSTGGFSGHHQKVIVGLLCGIVSVFGRYPAIWVIKVKWN